MTATRRMVTWWRALLGLAVTAMLAACAAVTLVPAYDEQIDAGVTGLYTDNSAFVAQMVRSAGTPAGSFARNTHFYDEALARVDALTARAEAHRALAGCPSARLLARVAASAGLPAEVRQQMASLPPDDCQVTLMRLIRVNYEGMRDVHQLRGTAGLPAEAQGQFIEGGVGAQLRAAIAVEIAKRGRKEDR